MTGTPWWVWVVISEPEIIEANPAGLLAHIAEIQA
jgi:hypothetical protein